MIQSQPNFSKSTVSGYRQQRVSFAFSSQLSERLRLMRFFGASRNSISITCSAPLLWPERVDDELDVSERVLNLRRFSVPKPLLVEPPLPPITPLPAPMMPPPSASAETYFKPTIMSPLYADRSSNGSL
uniref:Uncharacterized protein n=1 Tax=Anopheles quadriannulatus TaxID=34691 RepID=A0A182WRY8_ANOQN